MSTRLPMTPQVHALTWTRCPGPAGTWACALEFGHGGDHERFAPESTLTAQQIALLAGVRELRAERDELLSTCADLLAALKRMSSHWLGDGNEAEREAFIRDFPESAIADAMAAIAKAEKR